LTSGNSLSQILDAVARHFAEVFQRPIVVLLPDADRSTVRFRSAELVFSDRENEIVSWVFQKGQEAGCGTEVFPGSRIRYRPLKTGQGIVGVIGFQTKSSKDLLPPDQIELLGIFMNQTALAITRADLAQKAQRAEVLQEADKLQKALLNSVSHNLRTPLASVLGVLNTILEDGVHLDLPTQRSLLKTAQ
jgi:two-component system sensor histidine kinase KdpD